MLHQQHGCTNPSVMAHEESIIDDNPPSPSPEPEPIQIGVVPFKAKKDRTGIVEFSLMHMGFT